MTYTKTEIRDKGFRVHVEIDHGRVAVVMEDTTAACDISVIDMYHGDKVLRVNTDKVVRTNANYLERMF